LHFLTPDPSPHIEKFANLSGLHIVANFSVSSQDILCDSRRFKTFIDAQILAFNLVKVGEVYHDFPNGGYTAVVCLTESHLSIHTWPENNYLTFDIFLSNYMKDNSAITKALYEAVRNFFGAKVMFEQSIQR
jgi:S-adenosylmethionine decarboxylase